MPAPRLVITDETFHPDYFFSHGLGFASARFRETAALPDTVAVFSPVDASRCHARARDKDYRVLWVVPWREMIDVEASDLDFFDPGTGSEPIVASTRRIALLDGFVADVPMFRGRKTRQVFVSDAFAETMLRAGVEGAGFYAVEGDLPMNTVCEKAL